MTRTQFKSFYRWLRIVIKYGNLPRAIAWVRRYHPEEIELLTRLYTTDPLETTFSRRWNYE